MKGKTLGPEWPFRCLDWFWINVGISATFKDKSIQLKTVANPPCDRSSKPTWEKHKTNVKLIMSIGFTSFKKNKKNYPKSPENTNWAHFSKLKKKCNSKITNNEKAPPPHPFWGRSLTYKSSGSTGRASQRGWHLSGLLHTPCRWEQ